MVAKIRIKKIPQTRYCLICGDGFKTTLHEIHKCNKCATAEKYCSACGKQMETTFGDYYCSKKCELNGEIKEKQIKMCHYCFKLISKKAKSQYERSHNAYAHLICIYKDLKANIKDLEEDKKQSQENWEDSKNEYEEEIKEAQKEIDAIKDKMRKLSINCAEEIVCEEM